MELQAGANWQLWLPRKSALFHYFTILHLDIPVLVVVAAVVVVVFIFVVAIVVLGVVDCGMTAGDWQL